MIMSVMKDDEQNAAAKSNIALLSLSQAKPHEARKRSLFALLSCLRFSFFSRICKHTDSQRYYTDSQRYYTDRGALSRPKSSDRAGNGQRHSGQRWVARKMRWRGWLQGENRLQSSGRGGQASSLLIRIAP